MEYYLCSEAVIKHFPDIKRSKPFKSGYDYDKEDNYYVIAVNDYDSLEKYYINVIEPFNQKSNIDDIDYWLREICDSLLPGARSGALTKCRTLGVFKAIEFIFGVTNARNRAYAIYRMSDQRNLTPIEFINKAAKR